MTKVTIFGTILSLLLLSVPNIGHSGVTGTAETDAADENLRGLESIVDELRSANLSSWTASIDLFMTDTTATFMLKDPLTLKFERLPEIGELLQGAAATQVSILSWVNMEQDIAVLTDIWSDDDFRNLYDNIDSWGTTAGVFVAAAALIADETNSAEVAGWSLVAAGGSKIVGAVFGNQTGRKFEDKAGTIELSRAAYNDRLTRTGSLATQIQAAKDIGKQIEQYFAELDTSNRDEQYMVASIEATMAFARTLDAGFRNLLANMGELRGAVLRYVDNDDVNEKVRESMKETLTEIDDVEAQWNERVIKYLAVVPRVERELEVVGTM